MVVLYSGNYQNECSIGWKVWGWGGNGLVSVINVDNYYEREKVDGQGVKDRGFF